MFSVAGFVMPSGVIAQQHTRYRLVDLGTLGGPHSYGSVNGDGFSLLNNSGVVTSHADTALSDPNASFFCFEPDCFFAHAFRWKGGVMTDIGALPGNNNSAGGSINARGWVTGQSQIGAIDPSIGIPEFRATLWKQHDVLDLGVLPGGTESLGIYINDSGQVVGFSDNGIPDPFSFPSSSLEPRSTLSSGKMARCATLARLVGRTLYQARVVADSHTTWWWEVPS
jgi:uncharacterized membrane protein